MKCRYCCALAGVGQGVFSRGSVLTVRRVFTLKKSAAARISGAAFSLHIFDMFLFQMHVFGHFVEGGTQERVCDEVGVTLEEGLGFLSGDFDETGISEVAHGDIGDAGLAPTEESARAAEFQVFLGEEEAIGALDEGIEAIICAVCAGEEEAVRGFRAAADATAELVELGETEAIGVFDDHDGRIGYVDTHLDDRG